MYRCAECQAVAIVARNDDKTVIVRTCAHKDAAIVGSMTARAEGRGGVR